MSIFNVLKELFGKNEEENMLINELKSLFASERSLNSVSVILSGVSQLVGFIEQNANEGSRNAAIDSVIKLLEQEKK